MAWPREVSVHRLLQMEEKSKKVMKSLPNDLCSGKLYFQVPKGGPRLNLAPAHLSIPISYPHLQICSPAKHKYLKLPHCLQSSAQPAFSVCNTVISSFALLIFTSQRSLGFIFSEEPTQMPRSWMWNFSSGLPKHPVLIAMVALVTLE